MTASTPFAFFSARVFALFAVAILIAPAVFTAYTPPVHAIDVEEVANTTWQAITTAVKTAYSAVKNTITSIAAVTSAAKDTALVIERYVLQPLAYITTGNLLKSITSSMLAFVAGKNSSGKPLYIQNLRGYVQNVGDVEAYSFLNQFQSRSNSPFAGAITSSLRANYLQNTTLAGFFAANKSTLGNYSSNPAGFTAGNWSLGGWAAWFGLTTVPQNNPYTYYYIAQDQLSRQVATAQTAKITQANWGQGFLSFCGSSNPITGGAGGTTGSGDFGGGVSCPSGAVPAGTGGCAETNPEDGSGQFVLPVGDSCPAGTSFDGNWGGCSACSVGGGCDIVVPNGPDGRPVSGAGSSVAQDFNGSGDALGGATNAGIVGDGAQKLSAASGVSLTASTQIQQLTDIVGQASEALPAGYRVVVTSTDRPGATVANGGGTSQHALGDAIDVSIIGPNGVIPNRGSDTTGLYTQLAVAAYNVQQQSYPNLSGQLAWGGNFDTGNNTGVADLMHFDLGGDRGHRGTLTKLAQTKGSVSLAAPAPAASSISYNTALLAATDAAGFGGGSTAGGGLVQAGAANGVAGSGASGDFGGGGTPQPGDPCTKANGTEGTIQTPGSIIKDFLSNALKATSLDKLVAGAGDLSTQINGILGDVGTVLKTVNLATSLFGGNAGGLQGFAGTGNYTSPFAAYLSSPGYLGMTTSSVLSNPSTANVTSSDLGSRVAQYQAAWATIGQAAESASSTLNALIASCSPEASAAQTALTGEVAPVLAQYAAAQATIATANALLAQTAVDQNSSTDQSAYTNDIAAAQSTPPSATDIANVESEVQPSGVPPTVSGLSVSAATPVEQMNAITGAAQDLARSADCSTFNGPFTTTPQQDSGGS